MFWDTQGKKKKKRKKKEKERKKRKKNKEKKVLILGNPVFVSLSLLPNAGKLLPAPLTFTPLEITQFTVLLQAAKEEDGIGKW